MKYIKIFESYNNEDLEDDDWWEFMKSPSNVFFTKKDLEAISKYFSKWYAPNTDTKEADILPLYLNPQTLRTSMTKGPSKSPAKDRGFNKIDIHIGHVEILLMKHSDDWYYLSFEIMLNYEEDAKYWKCDSLEGLFIKMDELISNVKGISLKSLVDTKKFISNKISKMTPPELERLKKILEDF